MAPGAVASSAQQANVTRRHMTDNRRPGSERGALLSLTRIWLPIALAVAGVVMIVLGDAKVTGKLGGGTLSAAGVAFLLIALIVWMLNWLFRMSVESNRDRRVEEEAREYFDRHGHWPDER
jgi:membrane protein implicated in regulation of membrane protease activity